MKRFLDTALRYGVAVLAVGVALGLKLLLDPLITDQSPFLLLAGAVVVGAWFGGLGPGLLATALGALGADYFFLPPEGSFTGLAVAFWPLLLFTLQGILISSLVEALRSARKRAEQSAREARSHQESLRESEERFRLMVDGVKDYAIFMLDPGGCVTTWNDGAERIVGYGEGEILGRHFSSFYPEEDVERGHPEDILRAALPGRERRDALFFARLQGDARQRRPPRGANPRGLVRHRRHGGGRHRREARCGAFRPREGRARLRAARALPLGPRDDAGYWQGAQDRRT